MASVDWTRRTSPALSPWRPPGGLGPGLQRTPPLLQSTSLPVSALCDSLLSVPPVSLLFRRGLQLSYWVNRRVNLGKGGVRAPAPSTESRSCPGVCRDLFQESFILLGRPFQYPLVHVTSKMSSVLTPVDLRGTMDRSDSMHWDYQTRESAPS